MMPDAKHYRRLAEVYLAQGLLGKDPELVTMMVRKALALLEFADKVERGETVQVPPDEPLQSVSPA
jgi:hypothetical protein